MTGVRAEKAGSRRAKNKSKSNLSAKPTAESIARRLPVGAEVLPDGSVHFRVWAPRSRTVGVELQGPGDPKASEVVPLGPEGNGYFSKHVPQAAVGMLYKFRLDRGSFP